MLRNWQVVGSASSQPSPRPSTVGFTSRGSAGQLQGHVPLGLQQQQQGQLMIQQQYALQQQQQQQMLMQQQVCSRLSCCIPISLQNGIWLISSEVSHGYVV